MKKILSIVLSLIIIFTAFSFTFVSAQTSPTITVEKVTGYNGNMVDVKISIANNPGIMAMAFGITYDSTALEYINYNNGYLSNYNIKDHSDKGLVSFVNVEDSDVNTDGDMLILTFKIKDSAALGEYELSIVNSNPDKYGNSLHNSFANSSESFIVPAVNNGSITVVEEPHYLIGDITCDGEINNRDLSVLMRYINGWDVEVIEVTADVNVDNAINNKDFAILMQYINGWDVELGFSEPEKEENNYGNQGPLVFF